MDLSSSSSLDTSNGSCEPDSHHTNHGDFDPEEASRWAPRSAIPVSVGVSTFTGDGVEEIFTLGALQA